MTFSLQDKNSFFARKKIVFEDDSFESFLNVTFSFYIFEETFYNMERRQRIRIKVIISNIAPFERHR